jgi:orotate phosphoribosyltransferase
MAVVTEAGATVAGAGAIVDRSGGKADMGVPFRALVQLDVPTYQPEACPLCAAGQPVTKPGSRG